MNLLDWFGGGSSQRKEPSFGRDAVYLPDPMGRLDQGTWKPSGDLPDPFGRLNGPEPMNRFPISWNDDEVSLVKPVGPRGANRPADVEQIETFLGATGHLDLDATDGPTGYYGQRLDNAIKNYQTDNGLKVDGLIKPGGETIRTLADQFGPAAKPQAAGTSGPNDWDRFWNGRAAAKAGPENGGDTPQQRNMFLTPQDRAEYPRKSQMPMVLRPGYVWEDGYWRRETPDENLRRNIELFTEKASGNQPPDSHDDFTAYPQTGGKAPEGPDAGSGNRKPKPGETQVAAAPLAAGLPAAAEAAPWLIGAISAGIAGKEFLERYPNLRLPGVGGSDGTNADESDGSVENFRPPKLDGRVFPGTRPSVLEPFPAKPGAYPGPETGQAKPEIETFPAADEPQLGPLKGRKPEPRKPFVETLPDQSDEFDQYNIQDLNKLNRPNNLSKGERPDRSTTDELKRLQPGRLKDIVENGFLADGMQTHASVKGTVIDSGRPSSEGKSKFYRYVRDLGGKPGEVKLVHISNGTLHKYDDKDSGHTLIWRPFSSAKSGNKHTLEIQIKRGENEKFELKRRYNP